MTNDVVRTIRIQGRSEGLAELQAQVEKLRSSHAALAVSADAVGVATETASRRQLSAANAVARVNERYDEVARALSRATREFNTLQRGVDTGVFERSAAGAKRLADSVNLVGTAFKNAAEAPLRREQALIEQNMAKYQAMHAARMSAADEYQAKIESARRAEAARIDGLRKAEAGSAFSSDLNARLGIGRTSSARDSASVFADSFAAQDAEMKRVEELRKRASDMGRTHTPDLYETARTARAQAEILELRNKGIISAELAERYADAEALHHEHSMKSLAGSFVMAEKYAGGLGLARHEAINLSRQLQDVFVSLQGGQPLMTVLMQQGTQIADIFASSPAGAAGGLKTIMGWLTPMRLAIGGVSAAALSGALAWNAYDDSQRNVAASLMGLGRGAGLTVEGLNRVAEAAARAGNMSFSSARSIASEFAATGRIDPSMMSGLTSASRRLAIQTGGTDQDAAKFLASAFADPARGADQLNEKLGILNDRTREYIRLSVASGNTNDAQRAIFDALTPAIARAEERLSIFARAGKTVARELSDAWDKFGKVLDRIVGGGTSGDKLGALAERLANLQNAVKGNPNYRPAEQAKIREEMGFLQEDMRRREQAAMAEAGRQADSRTGIAAGDVIRSIIEDIGRIDQMRSQKSLLDKVVGDPDKFGLSADAAEKAREALDRLNVGINTFQTAVQRAVADGDLQVRQIMAYTLAERAAVEAQRAYTDTLRATRDTALAAVEAENARNRVVAEANRQARDALRDANYDAKLVGLSPYARGRQQILNQFDRMRQQNGGSVPGAAPASPSMDQWYSQSSGGGAAGVDPGFKSKVAALIDAIGDAGARMTSGFRSREKQQELYDYYGPGKAARPGSSQHEHGTAMDYVFSSGAARARAMELASQYGLRALPSNGGAIHFDNGRGGAANDNRALQPANGDIAAARSRSLQTYDAEQQVGPINQARLAIEAQNRTLDMYRQTAFATAEQQAYLNEKMRLYADFARNGITVTAPMAAAIEGVAKSAASAAEQIRRADFEKKQFEEWNSVERDAVKGFFSDMVNGLRNGQSGWQALQNAALNALNKIADKALSMTIDSLFFNYGGAGGGSVSGGGGLFGGLLKGLFSGGGAASAGSGIFNVGGSLFYADGGWTGSGSKYQPAGIVHANEYVIPSETVNRFGASYFDRYLPGYADGGYVSPSSAVAPPANSNISGAPIIVNTTLNVKSADGVTPEQLARVLAARDRDLPKQMMNLQRRA